MNCPKCNEGKMVAGKKSFFAQYDDYDVIIKNVPCMICPQCGEVMYSEDVMEKINYILEKIETFTNKYLITDYAQAA